MTPVNDVNELLTSLACVREITISCSWLDDRSPVSREFERQIRVKEEGISRRAIFTKHFLKIVPNSGHAMLLNQDKQ